MSDLKIEHAIIVTLDKERRILKDGAILVDRGVVTSVSKSDDLRQEAADLTIDGRGKVVTPGFFNNHIHTSYAHAVRGIFPDDLHPTTYLSHVFKLQSEMTADEEYCTCLLAITEMVKNGITCFLEPGSIKDVESGLKAIREAGCRAVIGVQVLDKENPISMPRIDTDEALKKSLDTVSKYHNILDGKVKAWVMPFSPNYATKDLLLGAGEIAKKYDTGLTLHCSTNEAQAKSFEEETGRRPVEYLGDLGLLGPNLLLSHMISASPREVDLLASTNTKVVHCPGAALKMGSGATRVSAFPEMIAKGICVSLGTDAANNSNNLDILRAVYLSAVLYKDSRQTTKVLPAETALEMGTVNGARGLMIDGKVGAIEEGKKADLVLFETRRCEWRSLFNPVNNLVYSADGRSVDTVIVDGQILVEGHKPLFVDERSLCEKVQQIGEDLLARTGTHFDPRWKVV